MGNNGPPRLRVFGRFVRKENAAKT